MLKRRRKLHKRAKSNWPVVDFSYPGEIRSVNSSIDRTRGGAVGYLRKKTERTTFSLSTPVSNSNRNLVGNRNLRSIRRYNLFDMTTCSTRWLIPKISSYSVCHRFPDGCLITTCALRWTRSINESVRVNPAILLCFYEQTFHCFQIFVDRIQIGR